MKACQSEFLTNLTFFLGQFCRTLVGAKKCGTTALKIFMNYHPGFRDTPGEKHFFNRPSNWKKGFSWYKDQSPLTYSDEVTYEKTPDYFDRSFVPGKGY